MIPERKTVIGGVEIAEFYWAGEYPCYVDHRLSSVNYDQVVALAEKGEDTPLVAWEPASK